MMFLSDEFSHLCTSSSQLLNRVDLPFQKFQKEEFANDTQCEKSVVSIPKPVPLLNCNNSHEKPVKTESLLRIITFQIFSILCPKL